MHSKISREEEPDIEAHTKDLQATTVFFLGAGELSESLATALGSAFQVICATPQRGVVRLARNVDVVVADLTLLEGADVGPDSLRGAASGIEQVLIVDRQNLESMIRTTDGRVDFLVRPCLLSELAFRVRRAADGAAARRRLGHLENAVESLLLAVRAREPSELSTDLLHLGYRKAMQLAQERVARDYLQALMQQVDGSVVRAAKRAELERESLHRLLKRYDIRSTDFKNLLARRR